MSTKQENATVSEQFLIMSKLADVLVLVDEEIEYSFVDGGDGELWDDMQVAAWVSEKLYGKSKIFDRLQAILSRVQYVRHNVSNEAVSIFQQSESE